MTRGHYELIARLAAEGDSVLVANPGVVAARLVQDKLGRPLASIVLQPWLVPSVHAMPTMPGWFSLPRWAPPPVVAGYLHVVNLIGYMLVGRHINGVRQELGLPAIRQVFKWWFSPTRMIGLFPDWYARPQLDWPAQLRLAGFPLFDGRPAAPLDPAIEAFCREGDRPIAFTLGTGMMHAAAFFREAIEACRLLGRRGILLTQFPDLLPQPLPPQVRHCRFAPFVQLFPLCGAVVHHGGIGTTAKALAAGVPQLVLPLAFDQLDNARRVRELGVGESLWPKQRTARHLADALQRLLQGEVQVRAQAIARERFNGEDPLTTAAAWIEELAPV
jgi:UDP:flavonoid glycosyltransferase YjiC (YdhE family)